MGLEVVKEEVLKDAKAEEEKLVAEAREEAKRMMKKAEKEIEVLRKKSEEEIRKKIDIIKKQELASAELENKKMLLEAKKDLIENVFAEVKKKVESLDSKKRQDYIEKLLEKIKNEIEVEYVYCNKKDANLVKDFKAEAADIIGGLIVENKDKTIKVDYSFDSMLESIKENELQEVNKILFS